MIDQTIHGAMEQKIYQEIYAGPKLATSRSYHDRLQHRLIELGSKLNFVAVGEHPVPWRAGNRRGRIDVFWYGHTRLLPVAIEIDSTWKLKSLDKLTRMTETARSIWIYYGHEPIRFVPPGSCAAKVNIFRADFKRLFERPIRPRPPLELNENDMADLHSFLSQD